jgi:hypothetical protein
MKEEHKGLIYVALGIFLMVFIADVQSGSIDSYFNSIVSFANFVVISVLTYYMYKVNKKVVDLNEKQLELNTRFLVHQKNQEFNRIIGKIESYIEDAKILTYFTLPHLSVNTKYSLLLTDDDDLFGIFALDKTIKEELYKRKDIRGSVWESLLEEETEDEKYIKKIYESCLPNSVKAYYKVEDMIKCFKRLSTINDGRDFLEYSDTLRGIKAQIKYIEKTLNPVFNDNETGLLITEARMDIHTAEILYKSLKALRYSLLLLRSKIINEQNLITTIK